MLAVGVDTFHRVPIGTQNLSNTDPVSRFILCRKLVPPDVGTVILVPADIAEPRLIPLGSAGQFHDSRLHHVANIESLLDSTEIHPRG